MSDHSLANRLTAELRTLLDAVPASRRVLPHLAVVEQRLRAEGLDCLGDLPVPVLEKAAAQLKNLTHQPENLVLPQLVSLLDLAIQARLPRSAQGGHDQFLSTFMNSDKLSISESSHTDFVLALEAQEAGAPAKGS